MAGALMSNIDSAADCKMKGSILVVEFPSEQDVKDWIAQDPYVLGNVWKDWTISPFRMAPFPQ